MTIGGINITIEAMCDHIVTTIGMDNPTTAQFFAICENWNGDLWDLLKIMNELIQAVEDSMDEDDE